MIKNSYLVLNAAEKRIQFVLGNQEEMLYAQDYAGQKNGTDSLFYFIDQGCKHINIKPTEITHLASVAGPGNFMGIRITALIASGLARIGALPKLQVGLNYLECLANNISGQDGEIVKIFTSATRQSLHCADYRFEQGVAVEISPLRLFELESMQDEYNFSPNYLLGSGVYPHRQALAKIYPKAFVLPEKFNNISLDTLYQQSLRASYFAEDISPIYLKQCDALENLNSIATKQGQDPQKAHAHLKKLMSLHEFDSGSSGGQDV